ncbi:hypothetical protein KL86APRO_11357 [uncultured Alphaproteobacteria bacterium]|uniref:Uncharacterized protein n=1 Tax=uncultured Alphaproteobacteria bacterium TaxID=91750 RepID=A0A212JNN7_9PROT|nr:hypothetical protein KL86APRO_11357 [uncultured Alphaproteobacteria bacterium]
MLTNPTQNEDLPYKDIQLQSVYQT